MKINRSTLKKKKASKSIALGAGIGMIFGAALGNIAFGLVLGAAGGLLFGSREKILPVK